MYRLLSPVTVPLHEGLVQSWYLRSTQPVQRSRGVRTSVTHTTLQRSCCSSITPPFGPLQGNTTSSTKSEVRNVLQRRQRKTEPRPQSTQEKDLVRLFLKCEQTHRRTYRYMLTAVYCSTTSVYDTIYDVYSALKS